MNRGTRTGRHATASRHTAAGRIWRSPRRNASPTTSWWTRVRTSPPALADAACRPRPREPTTCSYPRTRTTASTGGRRRRRRAEWTPHYERCRVGDAAFRAPAGPRPARTRRSERGLVVLGALLGAESYKPVGDGRTDSAWIWPGRWWLAVEAKSEKKPHTLVSHATVRQVNDQLIDDRPRPRRVKPRGQRSPADQPPSACRAHRRRRRTVRVRHHPRYRPRPGSRRRRRLERNPRPGPGPRAAGLPKPRTPDRCRARVAAQRSGGTATETRSRVDR